MDLVESLWFFGVLTRAVSLMKSSESAHQITYQLRQMS